MNNQPIITAITAQKLSKEAYRYSNENSKILLSWKRWAFKNQVTPVLCSTFDFCRDLFLMHPFSDAAEGEENGSYYTEEQSGDYESEDGDFIENE